MIRHAAPLPGRERVSQLGRILTDHDLPFRTRIAAAGDLPIDIDEVPLAEVEPAWHRRSGGRRIVFRP